MRKNIQKKVIDITGVEITPGEPTVCLGNGEQGFECCCGECNYYLLCFPEFEPKSKEKNSMDKDNYTKQIEGAVSLRIQQYQGKSIRKSVEIPRFGEFLMRTEPRGKRIRSRNLSSRPEDI